jgi:hypothetical protein
MEIKKCRQLLIINVDNKLYSLIGYILSLFSEDHPF